MPSLFFPKSRATTRYKTQLLRGANKEKFKLAVTS
jgi:hypothetical protein